jgi:hypothetical protein
MPITYIPCSYGELIDKYTILQIKITKAQSSGQKSNIQHELDMLFPLIKQSDSMSEQLLHINTLLWEQEDLIRYKSQNKIFDQTYIICAETIHQLNNARCAIKKKINLKYDSSIIEEKIYNINEIIPVTDINSLSTAMTLFHTEPTKSLAILSELMSKYSTTSILHMSPISFGVDLNMAYLTNTRYFGIVKPFVDDILQLLSMLDEERKSFYYIQVAIQLLYNKRYAQAYPFLPYLQPVKGPCNINQSNVGFFNEDDVDKTMLIYTSGGYGDIIMHGRFIPLLCRKYCNNKVILMCDKKLFWMFQQLCEPNLQVCILNDSLPAYDYHNNITALFGLLKYEYHTIPWYPYLQHIQFPSNVVSDLVADSFIVINWKGSALHNERDVPLKLLLDIFNGERVCTVQKNITDDERLLLESYGVVIIDHDNNPNHAFTDTVNLLKKTKLVISSDTSLLHLAGSVGASTVGLLTINADWRWTCEHGVTPWYPHIKLFTQQYHGDWELPLKDLRIFLNDYLSNT